MGFIRTGDSYNQRCDKALQRLNGITSIVDDALIASDTFESHAKDIRAFLQRCSDSNITLNRKKIMLGRSKVKFDGYLVCKTGIEVDPNKIEAVNRFPTTDTRQDLNRFMGLIN